MSYASYIAFPREADISCVESKYDESKKVTVGEIRGTKLEKEWEEKYGKGILDNDPNELSYYLGDMSDFYGITIARLYEDGLFDNIFANPFVYDFSGAFQLPDDITKMIESSESNAVVCRKQLYDIVILNLKSNEIIEIYTEWLDVNLDESAPPEKVIEIDAKEILTSKLLDLTDKTKIVIRRTE